MPVADVPQHGNKRANGLPAKTLETKAGCPPAGPTTSEAFTSKSTADFDMPPKILPRQTGAACTAKPTTLLIPGVKQRASPITTPSAIAELTESQCDSCLWTWYA